MKLSTKSRYSLRILLQIAIETVENAAINGKRISDKQDISQAYLEQIMIPLKEVGIVSTLRGPNGGYFISKPLKDITVLKIIELFEGEINLVHCNTKSKPCNRIVKCQTKNVWSKLSEVIRKEAAKINIAILLEEEKEGINVEYVI